MFGKLAGAFGKAFGIGGGGNGGGGMIPKAQYQQAEPPNALGTAVRMGEGGQMEEAGPQGFASPNSPAMIQHRQRIQQGQQLQSILPQRGFWGVNINKMMQNPKFKRRFDQVAGQQPMPNPTMGGGTDLGMAQPVPGQGDPSQGSWGPSIPSVGGNPGTADIRWKPNNPMYGGGGAFNPWMKNQGQPGGYPSSFNPGPMKPRMGGINPGGLAGGIGPSQTAQQRMFGAK